jgi:tetratricopeptide (TPR) repeat protein
MTLSLAALALPLLLAAPPAQTAAQSDEQKMASLLREAIEDGNLDEAITRGEKAITVHPKSGSIHWWLGRAYLARGEGSREAAAILWIHRGKIILEKAVFLDPSNIDAKLDLIGAHLRPGGIEGVNIKGAHDMASAIGRQDPAMGHLAQGILRESETEPEKAEVEYRKAFAAKPTTPRVLAAMVDFLVRRKRLDDAIAACEKASEVDPKLALPHYLAGKTRLMTGLDLPKALAAFDAFLALTPGPEGPSPADAHWRKGLVLERLGKKDDARAEYRKALELFPGHIEATKELARLGK